jgi:DNA mismatch repair protein MSH6
LAGRLDAVQDLLDHPTFEAEFMEIAKGLPDLERIVARIHAKSCRIRDFIKVLAVRYLSFGIVSHLLTVYRQAFKKLSRGLSKLADESESFKSKTILGLLRSAPDLLPNIKNVEDMYVRPSSDKGEKL